MPEIKINNFEMLQSHERFQYICLLSVRVRESLMRLNASKREENSELLNYIEKGELFVH